jgi:hypothetical protein
VAESGSKIAATKLKQKRETTMPALNEAAVEAVELETVRGV